MENVFCFRDELIRDYSAFSRSFASLATQGRKSPRSGRKANRGWLTLDFSDSDSWTALFEGHSGVFAPDGGQA